MIYINKYIKWSFNVYKQIYGWIRFFLHMNVWEVKYMPFHLYMNGYEWFLNTTLIIHLFMIKIRFSHPTITWFMCVQKFKENILTLKLNICRFILFFCWKDMLFYILSIIFWMWCNSSLFIMFLFFNFPPLHSLILASLHDS